MRKRWIICLVLLMAFSLTACSNNNQSQEAATGNQAAAEENQPPVTTMGDWNVNITNGTGRSITAIQVRAGASDDWSEEILGGAVWPEDLVLTVSFTDMEIVKDGWEAEVTFEDDGSTKVYRGLPLNDYSQLTLTAEGYEVPEE